MKRFCCQTIILLALALGAQASVVQHKLSILEASANGRLGVAAYNTADNSIIHYRAHETFPMGSTYKVFAVSAVLKQSVMDKKLMREKLRYTENDVISWSPVTKNYTSSGMTVHGLCEAAITYSDTTATNLLIDKIGGPDMLTSYTRSLNDDQFLMDASGYFSITSTPAAVQTSLYTLAFGDALPAKQQQQLIDWMRAAKTGKDRIPAGVPEGWHVAHKTGSGDYGVTNNIGIIWPPNGKPIVVAIYFMHENHINAEWRPDVVATATRLIIDAFQQES